MKEPLPRIISLVAIFIIFFVIRYIRKRNAAKATAIFKRPREETLPTMPKPNDKLVIITGTNYDLVKKVLIDFSTLYNKQMYLALPRLTNLNETQFAVTFPFDVSFEVFGYFINYLECPIDIEWTAEATGWATTKDGDEWVTPKTLNKKVMLFVLKRGSNGETIYITTQDGLGFKIDFSSDETVHQLKTPGKTYVQPTFTTEELNEKAFEDFK